MQCLTPLRVSELDTLHEQIGCSFLLFHKYIFMSKDEANLLAHERLLDTQCNQFLRFRYSGQNQVGPSFLVYLHWSCLDLLFVCAILKPGEKIKNIQLKLTYCVIRVETYNSLFN